MNIAALRSFLDVAESGSFSVAAARIGVTQSTVSARIQALEANLGVRLLRRSRNGVELTLAGEQVRAHADQMIRTWEQARLQVMLPDGYDQVFRLGGPVSIEDRLSLSWTIWMMEHAPTVALHLEAGTSTSLCERLLSGNIDAAIMFLPQRRPGLVIEELFQEHLVLVRHRDLLGDWTSNYVSVDWGPEFNTVFHQAFPHVRAPVVTVGLGVMGMHYVTALKGAGYLPFSFIRSDIDKGLFVLVDDAPRVLRSIYLVYPAHARDTPLLTTAIAGLRHVASTRQ